METKEPRTEPIELHIEWQNLRAEVYELDKACLAILQVTTAISAALIGWYLTAKEPQETMITMMSPIWMLAYSYLYHKRLSLRRVEGYLRVVLESQDYMPKWEKKLQKFRTMRPFRSKINTELIEFIAAFGVQVGVLCFTSLRSETFKSLLVFPSRQTVITLLISPSIFGLALPVIFSVITYLLFRFLVGFNNNLVDDIWKKVENTSENSQTTIDREVISEKTQVQQAEVKELPLGIIEYPNKTSGSTGPVINGLSKD